MRPIRTSALCFAAAALVGLGLGAARAEPHCEGETGSVYLFSNIGLPGGGVPGVATGTPSYQSMAIGCQAGEDPDTRYIYPGSNQVSLRYINDLKVLQLTGHIKGLGIDQDVVLKRGQNTVGAALAPVLGESFLYDSPQVALDPTATGTIVVTVSLPDGTTATNTYRTVA